MEEFKMKNVIVLFEVTIRDGKMDSYLEAAASLKESLENAEGFLKSERFSSLNETGKLLSMSLWKDEESIEKWRNLAAHRMCQKQGRMNDFASYTITVVSPIRSYTMTERENAPADSDHYFEG
jgi:heme-degrading monooxygenase HmoA